MNELKSMENFINKSGELQKKLSEMAPKIEKVRTKMINMGKSISTIADKMMGVSKKIYPFINIGLKIVNVYLSVNKMMNKASTAVANVSNGMSSMAGKIKGSITSLMGGVINAVSSMVSLANKTAEAAKGIDKMSQTTGLSTTRLQELKYAASQTGVDFSCIQQSAGALSQTMEQAANGGTQQVEAFNALGISLLDNNEKMLSTDEVYNQTLMKLAAMGDETERNALGTQIFGEGFTNMIPMLDAGAEGIQRYSEQANQFGLVMGEEAIDANLQFSNSMGTIASIVDGLKQRFATALLPIIQLFLDWVINNMPTIQGIFNGVFEFINTVVGKVVTLFKENFMPVLTILLQWLSENFPAIQGFFTTVFNVIWEVVSKVFKGFSESLLPILMTFLDWLMENLPAIQEFFITAFSKIWEIVQRVFKIFQDDLLPILETLYNWVEPFFPVIASIIEEAFGIVINVVEGVIDIFEDVIESIKRVMDFVNSMIEGIKKALDWLGRLLSKSSKHSHITVKGKTKAIMDRGTKKLANGGRIMSSGRVLVGERGPEILDLPKNARVLPLERAGARGINRSINQSITINSPTPLSPSEIKKKTLEVSRQLAMEWGV